MLEVDDKALRVLPGRIGVGGGADVAALGAGLAVQVVCAIYQNRLPACSGHSRPACPNSSRSGRDTFSGSKVRAEELRIVFPEQWLPKDRFGRFTLELDRRADVLAALPIAQ